MIYIILQGGTEQLAQSVNETLNPNQAVAAATTQKLTRTQHHKLAAKGAVLFSDDPADQDSPLFVGKLEDAVPKAKSVADYMDGRLAFFINKLPANYVGRIYDDPRIILVGDSGDWKIFKYLDIMPKDWWGSLGFISEYEPKKLYTALEMYLPNSTPVVISDRAYELLKPTGLDIRDAREYPLTDEGGRSIREVSRV